MSAANQDIRAVLIQTDASRVLLPPATTCEVRAYAEAEPRAAAPGRGRARAAGRPRRRGPAGRRRRAGAPV